MDDLSIAFLDYKCNLLRRLMTFKNELYLLDEKISFVQFHFFFYQEKHLTYAILSFVLSFGHWIFALLINCQFKESGHTQQTKYQFANKKKAIFYACKSAEHTKYIRIFSIQFRYIFHFFTFIYSDMPPAFIYSLLFILLWKYYRSQIYKRYCFQSHRLNDNCVWFFGKHEIGRAR